MTQEQKQNNAPHRSWIGRHPVIATVLVVIVAVALFRNVVTDADAPSKASRKIAVQHGAKRIDRVERLFFEKHGRYTDHIADLLAMGSALAGGAPSELFKVPGTILDLDASTNGRAYSLYVSNGNYSCFVYRVGRDMSGSASLSGTEDCFDQ